jgi:hypothetical protein
LLVNAPLKYWQTGLHNSSSKTRKSIMNVYNGICYIDNNEVFYATVRKRMHEFKNWRESIKEVCMSDKNAPVTNKTFIKSSLSLIKMPHIHSPRMPISQRYQKDQLIRVWRITWKLGEYLPDG